MPPLTLVVEDEPAIRLAVRDSLAAAGHEVAVAEDGRTALTMALSHRYDLIVLDLMLPGMPGMEVCRKLREAGKRTPLLMLTARGGESDRVDGLQAGADDYLPKPFSVRELLARCEALLRRASWDREPPSTTLRVGGATIDLGRLEIVGEGGGDPIALTAREAEILSYLAGREGRVASKRELLLDVWGYPDVPIETRTVENTVGVLRRKLDSAVGESGPAVIVTVRGAGFKLANEVDVACGG